MVVAHVEVVVVADPLFIWGPAALSPPVGKGAVQGGFSFVRCLFPVREFSSFVRLRHHELKCEEIDVSRRTLYAPVRRHASTIRGRGV